VRLMLTRSLPFVSPGRAASGSLPRSLPGFRWCDCPPPQAAWGGMHGRGTLADPQKARRARQDRQPSQARQTQSEATAPQGWPLRPSTGMRQNSPACCGPATSRPSMCPMPPMNRSRGNGGDRSRAAGPEGCPSREARASAHPRPLPCPLRCG
jgi:hypothetical protein